jgi:hypothetical protein
MKVDTYKLISNCIERGIDIGWQRAHKYTDHPEVGHLKETIYDNILIEICEYFNFSSEVDSKTNVI